MDKEKREQLGREVRNVWVEFAKEQEDPKPAHLLGWDELDEANKEVDRRIGERIAEMVLENSVLYLPEWQPPVYQFGQVVCAGSDEPMEIVGMRFGRWQYGGQNDFAWRYQIEDNSGYCDGKWHRESDLASMWIEEQ